MDGVWPVSKFTMKFLDYRLTLFQHSQSLDHFAFKLLSNIKYIFFVDSFLFHLQFGYH